MTAFKINFFMSLGTLFAVSSAFSILDFSMSSTPNSSSVSGKKLYLSRRIILEDSELDGGLLVNDEGKIEDILTRQQCDALRVYSDDELEVTETADGTVLMAGAIDSHVHVNQPGRTAWEGFRTATEAAAAGGATTIADMPLNSIPPTTTVQNLRTKARSAKENVYVDVAFWGGVIPGNENDLKPLVKAGVVGFKGFLCPSGVDEFPNVGSVDLQKAFAALEGTGSVLAFHAELQDDDTSSSNITSDPNLYSTYLASRPPHWEVNALKLVSSFTKQYDVRVHIVHVSAGAGIPVIEEMRRQRAAAGRPIASLYQHGVTAETCFHYLTLPAEQVPYGATQFKCSPPLREAANMEVLWQNLRDGKLDQVVSDHSPCTADLKCCDFLTAWGGISSVQFGLPLFWTGGRERGFTLHDATRLLSQGPARLIGLDDRKGALRPGLDADFIIFDPDQTFVVREQDILYKNKLSPYLGMQLTGKVKKTYLRGKLIYDDNELLVGGPSGQLLLKDLDLSDERDL